MNPLRENFPKIILLTQSTVLESHSYKSLTIPYLGSHGRNISFVGVDVILDLYSTRAN